MALPYLPGAFAEYTKYKWKGLDGATDSKGKKYSLGGNLSDNLAMGHDNLSDSFLNIPSKTL